MSERSGVLVAIVANSFGAGAAVSTRYLADAADPITLAAIRFGGGVLCLLPLVLMLPVRWPPRQDWPAVAGLGFMFFGVFFIFYNMAFGFTTVARGALALSTLPLITMVIAALLGVEALSTRKTAGVLVAMLGVTVALASGLRDAPADAWRGDLIMGAAVACAARRGWQSAEAFSSASLCSLAGSLRPRGSTSARHGPHSIWPPAAARSISFCGCWHCNVPAPLA